MRTLSTDVSMDELFRKDKKKDLVTRLREESNELIDSLVKYEAEQLYELKAILALKDPSGLEIEDWQVKEFLSNLPYHIMAIHSLYLQIKREREAFEEIYEKQLGILRSKAEEDIISYRIGKKKEGYSLSAFGNITKEALMDKIRTYENYNETLTLKEEIADIKYKEDFLNKLVSVLENRR